MSRGEEYREGRRDGLREAVAALEVEEAKYAEREGTGKVPSTRQRQAARRQALAVAITRVRTTLHRREREDREAGHDTDDTTINAALARLGL